ncbi:hypothetical protein OKW29_000253 [Paraburkholderia sp. CI3]
MLNPRRSAPAISGPIGKHSRYGLRAEAPETSPLIALYRSSIDIE